MRCRVPRVLLLAVVATAASSAQSFGQDAPKATAPAGRPKAAQAPRAAAAPAQADPNDPRMKQLLAAWEKKSAKLLTLDVKIHRIDKSPAWGNEEFEGRALLESPDHAWLDFKKVDVDEKGEKKFVPFDRIICTGNEVWQYKPEVKQIFIFPLDKKNKQRALEEGPLPFLFNMKAAEAEARYLMALGNETKTAYVISVVPRLQVDQEAFSKAFIQLDRATYYPDRIFLISPDGTSTKDFRLYDVKPNAAIAAANFKGVDPGRPWQIVRDPAGDAPAPKGAGVTKRQAPAGPANAPPRKAAGVPRRAPAN